jgi:hypothetical protein
MDTGNMAVAENQVLYLYGVIPKGQSYPSEEGVPLQAVSHSDLVALVEPVSAQEFSSATLDQKLEDIEWVSRLARRHENVLESAMRYGVVAPARLCLLFSSAPALLQSLAANEERFLAALDRMRGRKEWGVKAYCAEGEVRSRAGRDDAKIQSLDVALATAAPGYGFILRKQRDARLLEIVTGRVYDVADEASEALERESVEVRLLRLLPSDEPDGRGGEIMVLNLAALVDDGARESFRSVVAELADRFFEEGFRFEVSGPWPPYNFCTQDEEDSATGLFEAGGERA